MPKAKKQFDGRGSEADCACSPLFAKYFEEERAFLKDLLFNSIKINELNFACGLFKAVEVDATAACEAKLTEIATKTAPGG